MAIDITGQPEIVQQAYNHGIVDLGQITAKDRRLLNKAVKAGILMEMKDFDYPVTKNRYIMNWHDLIEMFRNDPNYINDTLKENKNV